jgi:hypothetical protein
MTPATGQAPRPRLVGPDELPAPATDDLSLAVTDTVETLARLRTAYWLGDTGVHLHALASLLAQAHARSPTPSQTPATRAPPGPRSANSSASPPTPPPGATDLTTDQLDRDHPHNADERALHRGSSRSGRGGHLL